MSDFRRSVMATTNAAREMQRQNAASRDLFGGPAQGTYGPPETISDTLCTYGNVVTNAGEMYTARIKRSVKADYTLTGFYLGVGSPVAAAQVSVGLYEIRADSDGFIRLHLIRKETGGAAAGGAVVVGSGLGFGADYVQLDRNKEYVFGILFHTATTFNGCTYRDMDAALLAGAGTTATEVRQTLTAIPDVIDSGFHHLTPSDNPYLTGATRVFYVVFNTSGANTFIY